ncbi:hypothetical protein BKA61DRAFT_179025 [Leptodontidium sp. MPI-SDFR-AT-0119]|nr:hypothetical protein BKA61DRAFT_179025 [Leptodontidium sp. MPI-SDFR-AT-0119]
MILANSILTACTLIILSSLARVQAAADSNTNTCSRDLKPQPIGIDFGPNTIIATYAHTPLNTSILTFLTPSSSPAAERYKTALFRLRLEDYAANEIGSRLWGVNKNKNSNRAPAFRKIHDGVQKYLSPYLRVITSEIEGWVRKIPVLGNTIEKVSELRVYQNLLVAFGLKKNPWFEDDLTLDSVKGIFIAVLNETKVAALAQDLERSCTSDRVNIDFAILSVPDFFNRTLCQLVLEAAREVGISSLERTVGRTVTAGIGVQEAGLLASSTSNSDPNSGGGDGGFGAGSVRGGSWRGSGMRYTTADVKAEPTSKARNLLPIRKAGKRAERILVVEQGLFYAGLRTYEAADGMRSKPFSSSNLRGNGKGQGVREYEDEQGVFQQRYLPLDPYASQNIDNELFQRVLDRDGFLREVVRSGGERERQKLRDEVVKGRFLIRGGLEREFDFMGRGRGKKDEGKVGEEEGGEEADRHVEEWPLSLGGASAVLKWEDVQAVEEEYVRKIAEAVHVFLVTLRRIRTSNDLTHHPETIHTVGILTDHTDGHLLVRAIREALGPDVKIVGGTMSSSTLAAEGAAKLALRRLESWEEVFREERMREFLGSMKTERKEWEEEL